MENATAEQYEKEVVLTPEEEEWEHNLYLQMKESPEWEVLPKPARWYKKYNIPAPKPVSTPQYLKDMQWIKSQFNPNSTWVIKTEPAPGGVRPIIDTEKTVADLTDSKFKPFNNLINEIVADNQQQTQREREGSTECNTTNIQHV